MTKKLIFNLLFMLWLVPFNSNAQVTYIPDLQFEQALINLGIDSDNTVNGQILTSDAEAVYPILDLGVGPSNISFDSDLILDLTGINAFTNVDYLELHSRRLDNGLDISNLANLKIIGLNNCSLTSVSFNGNSSLEYVQIGNVHDIAGQNEIIDLDFTNNPNIKKISASNLYTLQRINLKNGQNINKPEMVIALQPTLPNNPNSVCIEVDNATAAINNLAPYNTWQVSGNHFYSDNCILSVEKFVKDNIFIAPNPATDYFAVINNNSEIIINTIQILDNSGKWISSIENNFEKISVENFSSGQYFIIIHSNFGLISKKLIVK